MAMAYKKKANKLKFLHPAFLGAAAVFCLVAQTASAQTPRYTRDSQKVKVKVKQTQRTKGLKESKGSAKPEAAAPEVTADDVILGQAKAKKIKKATIQAIEEAIEDSSPKDKDYPDLLLRLAGSNAEYSRFWRFTAFDMFERIESTKSKAKKADYKSKQKAYFNSERKYLIEAIKAYKKLADNEALRSYKRRDEALFYYAYTLRQAKNEDSARKIFAKLVREHPNSKYVPDGYLALADGFFEKDDLENADLFYRKVLKFPKSRSYAYALYKTGWIDLNRQNYKKALGTFSKVADITKGNDRQKVLNKASKKDVVRAYAEIGNPRQAFKLFKRVDDSYSFTMLKQLGELYLSKGEAAKTIYVYREMIKARPKDEEVCEWQYKVVQAMLTTPNKEDQASEVERLVKLYVSYRDKKVLSGTPLKECRDNARLTTAELGKLWHNESQKTLNLDTLGDAERMYKVYLDNFPKADDVGEIEYYYAELLWQRATGTDNDRLKTERWERTAEAFTDVVKRSKIGDKLRKEAAYASVLAWKNALDVDPRSNVKVEDPDERDEDSPLPKPKKISERQQKMLDAFDIYLEYIKDPKDEERVTMKFLKGRVYWRHYQFDKSDPIFEDIVANHLDHPSAPDAAIILINSLRDQEKMEELSKWTNKLLKEKKFLSDKEELKLSLLQIQGQIDMAIAKNLEKQGKHRQCGDKYFQIYNSDTDAKNADVLLYNAGVCYEEAKQVGLAIAAFAKLNERFEKSVHRQKALVRMGTNYAAIAYYKQAAEKYEEYSSRFGGEPDAGDALSNAVIYRKGIGDDTQAIRNTEAFVKKFKRKQKDKAAEAYFSMTGIYEKQGKEEDAKRHLEKYLKEFGSSGGRDRVVIAHAKIGKILWEQSCRGKTVNGSCIVETRKRATRRKGKRRKGSELPKQCGPESKIKLKVVERDSGLVRQAMKHFKSAVSEYKRFKPNSIKGEMRDARTASAVYWFAAARFHSIEQDYEKFLAKEFPTGLDFDPNNKKKAEKSLKRFKDWFSGKNKTAVRLSKAYEAVRSIRGGGFAWRIAGAARIGQIAQNFADGLFTAEIPKDVRSGKFAEDKVYAFCDQLAVETGPLEKQSVKAYEFCLNTSTKLNWFNSWSELCERELGQIDPGTWPTASEVHAQANRIAPVLDRQGLISELKGVTDE